MKINRYFQTKKKAVSLVELILYIGLVTTILGVVVTYFYVLNINKIRNQTVSVINEQGQYIMSLVTQYIRNASSITLPVLNTSGSSLSLVMSSSPTSIIFNLNGDSIQIKEDAASPIRISNSKIILSGLIFINASQNTAKGNIRVQFTLSYINPENRKELDYSQTFISSATLK